MKVDLDFRLYRYYAATTWRVIIISQTYA